MKSIATVVLELLIAALIFDPTQGGAQCLSVRGRVHCPMDRDFLKPVLVRLADQDRARRDDPMDEGYVSSTGAFELYGCASDPLWGTIDPIVKIYHQCKGSSKKVTLVVPKDFVGREYNFTRLINLRDFYQSEEDHEPHAPRCSEVRPPTNGQQGHRSTRERMFFL